MNRRGFFTKMTAGLVGLFVGSDQLNKKHLPTAPRKKERVWFCPVNNDLEDDLLVGRPSEGELWEIRLFHNGKKWEWHTVYLYSSGKAYKEAIQEARGKVYGDKT